MGVKVICTCPLCINHQVTVDGQQIPGKKVSSQARRRHEISAAASRSPDFSTKPTPIGTKDLPENLNEDNLSDPESPDPKHSLGVWYMFFYGHCC